MNRSTKPKTAPPKPADMKRAINQLWCGVSLVRVSKIKVKKRHGITLARRIGALFKKNAAIRRFLPEMASGLAVNEGVFSD
jgi:hypothetical protein